MNIEGPLSPYKFEYTIGTSTGYTDVLPVDSFFIQFDFQSSFLGNKQGNFEML